MAKSPPSSPTSAIPLNNTVNDYLPELVDVNMELAPDTILQGLNDSRSELLNRVQSLKQDLQDWRGKLDTEVNSYNEEIGGLKNSLNSEVEQLKNEFQELRNTLKEQLAVTTSKLAELDTSVVDCAQYLEGLTAHCELEEAMFDDLISDIELQNVDTGKYRDTLVNSNPNAHATTLTIKEIVD